MQSYIVNNWSVIEDIILWHFYEVTASDIINVSIMYLYLLNGAQFQLSINFPVSQSFALVDLRIIVCLSCITDDVY